MSYLIPRPLSGAFRDGDRFSTLCTPRSCLTSFPGMLIMSSCCAEGKSPPLWKSLLGKLSSTCLLPRVVWPRFPRRLRGSPWSALKVVFLPWAGTSGQPWVSPQCTAGRWAAAESLKTPWRTCGPFGTKAEAKPESRRKIVVHRAADGKGRARPRALPVGTRPGGPAWGFAAPAGQTLTVPSHPERHLPIQRWIWRAKGTKRHGERSRGRGGKRIDCTGRRRRNRYRLRVAPRPRGGYKFLVHVNTQALLPSMRQHTLLKAQLS